MWQEVFNLAINNGLWAVLFLGLLVYQLKDSRVREEKYQKTIENLNSSLTMVNKINKDVEVIDSNVNQISSNVIAIDKKIQKISGAVNHLNNSLSDQENVNVILKK